MGTDRPTDRLTDTEANTIVRPLYLFITIVIVKEGRTKKPKTAFNGAQIPKIPPPLPKFKYGERKIAEGQK
jgi:hypothetical protein